MKSGQKREVSELAQPAPCAVSPVDLPCCAPAEWEVWTPFLFSFLLVFGIKLIYFDFVYEMKLSAII